MLFKQLRLACFLSQACALTGRQNHDPFGSSPWVDESLILSLKLDQLQQDLSHFPILVSAFITINLLLAAFYCLCWREEVLLTWFAWALRLPVPP